MRHSMRSALFGSPISYFFQHPARRQKLWGGWTYAVCGAEVDKWGRELHGIADERLNSPAPPLTDEKILHTTDVTFLERLKAQSPAILGSILLMVLADIVIVYYIPGSLITILLGWAALYIWYSKF